MPLVLPRRSLNFDFVRDGQASGDNYTTELSKLDGLLTFARASTATRFNASGVLETVASGQPRFDFDPLTLACKGLLIEEARTNLVLRSQSLATSPWGVTGAPTITSGADTSCGVPLDLINDATGTESNYCIQDIVTGVAGGMVVSFFVRKGTSETAKVQVYDITANAFRGRAVITWSGAVPALALDQGASGGVVQQINANVYRCSFAVAGVVAANTTRLYIIPAVAAAGNTYFGGAQLEAGAFATSYIPTTAAAVTRAAETFSTSSLAPWFNASEGTVLADFETRGTVPSGTNFHVWALDDGGDNNRLMLRAESGGLTAFVTAGAVVQASFNFGANVAQRQRVGLIYALNNFAASRDGATAVTDNAGSVPAVTTLRLGHDRTNTQHLNGWLRRLVYLPYPASVTLLKALST